MSEKKDSFLSGFKTESLLNREDGTLPFGYYNPESDGKVSWMCGHDAEGKITSVFKADTEDGPQKQCEYVDETRAREMRDILIREGWKPIQPPKVDFTYHNGQKLNRRQRKYMERKLKQLNDKNPFKDGK